MIKIQIKSIFGKVIFEYEKESNTIAETVKEYIRQELSKDLSYADLSYANLGYADLSYANLSYADLSYANLSYANLGYADLSYANLGYADLSYANLGYADLLDTYITTHSKWWVGMKNDLIKIGCKEKTIEEWDAWFAGTETFSTPRGTKEFAKIQAHYLSVRAYVLFMKDFKEE